MEPSWAVYGLRPCQPIYQHIVSMWWLQSQYWNSKYKFPAWQNRRLTHPHQLWQKLCSSSISFKTTTSKLPSYICWGLVTVAVLEKFVQWLRSLYILCCLDKRTLAVWGNIIISWLYTVRAAPSCVCLDVFADLTSSLNLSSTRIKTKNKCIIGMNVGNKCKTL